MTRLIIPFFLSLGWIPGNAQTPAVVGFGYRVPTQQQFVAPGQIVTLFVSGAGKHLTTIPLRPSDPSAPLPNVLGGISVTLRQKVAPAMLSVPILAAVLVDTCYSYLNTPCNPSRFAAVAVQIPFELATVDLADPNRFPEAILNVQEDGVTSGDFLVIAIASNIHFATGRNPLGLDSIDEPYIRGGGAVFHSDGSPVAPESPAHPGEIVTVYGYGFGRPSNPVKTGEIAPAANPMPVFSSMSFSILQSPGASTTAPDTGYILPDYAGVAPQAIGLYQLNFKAPAVPDTAAYCDGDWKWNFIITVPSGISPESVRFCVRP